MNDSRRTEAALAVAHAWRASRLEYRLVHGVTQDDPPEVGRDLDVVVRRRDTHTAIEVARSALTKIDYSYFLVRHQRGWGVTQFIAWPRDMDPSAVLPIDLLHGDRVWTNLFAYSATVNRVLAEKPVSRLGFDFAPVYGWLKAVLRPLMVGDIARFTMKPTAAAEFTAPPPPHTGALLRELAGSAAARCVLLAVAGGDPSEAARAAKAFRRSLILRQALRHPLWSVRGLLARGWQVTFSRRTGPDVILELPEGLDPSAITARLAGAFWKVQESASAHGVKMSSTSEPTLLLVSSDRSSGRVIRSRVRGAEDLLLRILQT